MGIKGKTTFELTDVNTGEVEIIEDNNMVTNALQEFMLTYGMFNNCIFTNDNITNALCLSLLGGLFLFDTALDEDVDNTFMPAGVKMVGNGSDFSNNGAVEELGTYNKAESGIQSDGSIKFVYDYATNQANGTIACACLTSKVGGYMGMGNSEESYASDNRIDAHQSSGSSLYLALTGADDYYFNILYPVYNENAIYCTNPYNIVYESAESAQHWSATKKIEILRVRAGFTSVGIKDTRNLKNVIDSFKVDIPQDILDYMGTSTATIIPVGDSFNRNIFLIFNKSTNSIDSGDYCWIMKIDKDRNVTAHKFTNNVNEKLSLMTSTSGRKYYTINGDYLWVAGSSHKLYGIKYSDSTQIIDTGENVGAAYPRICSIAENLVGIIGVTRSGAYPFPAYSIYDVVNRTYRQVNGEERSLNYMYIPFADKKGVYLSVYTNDSHCKMEVVKDVRYLATINNLSEPVVKTSSKTMKVTYTIMEE